MLHKGFLHRDIGIPTIFLLPDPTEMIPFVPGNFGQVLEQSQAGKDNQILQDQVERLRKAIADLGITGSCCGVVQPSDMAVEMKIHYASGENAHQPVSVPLSAAGPMTTTIPQDYYEFMSSGLLRSVRLLEPYLHSPVDDLESFYYTMQWAAVHNANSSTGIRKTDYLEDLRARLSSSADDRFQATLLVHRIRSDNLEDVQKFGTFLTTLQPFLEDWYPSILALIKSWRTVKDRVDGTDDVSQYYIRHALLFAYRGVTDYLKIVHKYRESLK